MCSVYVIWRLIKFCSPISVQSLQNLPWVKIVSKNYKKICISLAWLQLPGTGCTIRCTTRYTSRYLKRCRRGKNHYNHSQIFVFSQNNNKEYIRYIQMYLETIMSVWFLMFAEKLRLEILVRFIWACHYQISCSSSKDINLLAVKLNIIYIRKFTEHYFRSKYFGERK